MKEKNKQNLEVDNFEYILKKNHKIIGLVCESPDSFELILRPREVSKNGNSKS